MNRRILTLVVTLSVLKSPFSNLSAKTSMDIDGAISLAAVDIADKCSAKSILAIDDFESLTQEMTLYIREQLADSIFAEDGLIQIVTRKHLDKAEKELDFQNSGVVSEQTILSAAERLGARFIVFGKLEEFNGSYVLRVRMLDVKTGAYLFRKTYNFQYSQKAEQLLGRAPRYKKASAGLLLETNKNSLDFIAPSLGFAFDYSPWRKFSMGTKGTVSYDVYEKNNELVTLETLFFFKFYIVSLSGEPVSGIYTELQAGCSTFFVNSGIMTGFNGGISTGYRFVMDNFYIEPEFRFGYPYIFGCGVYAGMRF
ncbi:hypothetical protein [Treponema berlinense]|uniref:hypothetical protein n=1 Tax=Treponema berlinense TaxID=225004 RepID=UPI0026ED6A7E|nr:hypothetical protein [Treponema berlinense]